MSINQKIESTLSGMVPDIWPFVCPEEEAPEEYIVYNMDEAPEGYADDKAADWTYYIQIHLFTKSNYIKKKKQIKEALEAAEFLMTDIQQTYEKESGYYHVVFQCEIMEGDI